MPSVAGLLALGVGTALLAGPYPSTRGDASRAYAAALAYPRSERSCAADIGRKTASTLARYCRYVSSATHPPCNPRNSCATMVEHILSMCRGSDSSLPCAEELPRP